MALIAEPDTPGWFQRFVLALKDEPVAAKGPFRLRAYISTALPDPVKNPETIIAVSDKGTLAYSNGVFWYPVTLGAHY